MPTREDAWHLLCEYTESDSLKRHGLAVEQVMRKMAKKYHPDKVASLGEDVKKQAEEKFRQVQDAYESLKKERGF